MKTYLYSAASVMALSLAVATPARAQSHNDTAGSKRPIDEIVVTP